MQSQLNQVVMMIKLVLFKRNLKLKTVSSPKLNSQRTDERILVGGCGGSGRRERRLGHDAAKQTDMQASHVQDQG
jgi:hypothetical protein